MRSPFLTCIAVVTVSLCPRLVSEVCAANPTGKAPTARAPTGRAPKGKAAAKAIDKKTPAELHADDKSMNKQMQWEDNVMGPDRTRADLARVARAHALNEKAIKDRDAQAARDAVAPPPVAAKTAPKRAEVALPSVSDGANDRSDHSGKPREISAKLSSDEAKAPVPAAKPADDKFIDKLLRDEQESTSSRKKSASASDRDLDRLLAGANEKRAGRRDDVDKLLKNADSGPAMPAPRAASALPAWTQQPDISPSPAPAVAVVPAPIASRSQKKNDGVIRVVQSGPPSSAPVAATEPPSRASRSSRAPSARATSASGANWNDPFAESGSPSHAAAVPVMAVRKAAASRPSAASTEWNDPFADKADGKTARRSASGSVNTSGSAGPAKRGDKADPAAHPAGWKDPFTKGPYAGRQPSIAMRDLGKPENARWDLASHHAAPKVATAEPPQGWGVLKKRAR
ncbi:MAG: hypothetical protein JWM82_4326 [Myxococcales bacterium]|nr:hypothetical protein [Myxococcales bacterium]